LDLEKGKQVLMSAVCSCEIKSTGSLWPHVGMKSDVMHYRRIAFCVCGNSLRLWASLILADDTKLQVGIHSDLKLMISEGSGGD